MASRAERLLAVCVDDFGLHDGVNQAVFDLLAMRRISAVSCLVDGPSWASGAAHLREAIGAADRTVADVGLHLNFTETLDVPAQSACPSLPLGALIKACYLGRLNVARLVTEIERQWDRFEAVWGRAPDFIDGHQHAHQLPQIRDALLQVLRRRYPAGQVGVKPWVRQCRAPGWQAVLAGISVSDTVKAAIIATLGASVIGRGVVALGLRRSERLLGVYPFDADAQAYVQRWQAWLKLVRPRGDLLMCHPSVVMQVPPPWPDVIAQSRRMEHAVLTGDAFACLLADARVRIVRLSSLA
ncbi:MAG: ChbG/HpnK family deacetylase [Aquabacterium sp.]|uniref:ChbG/HpnK family deacetylase n=1 Tax=Aquabacterium sp. TaxID=1872578 RepID=UPI0011F729F8|nr:ChbG/HpnK family deacetylase [Aquabacterium sp.]TAK97526.1 MAG: ChbG/HpnK family deacetylase [Aquabacterium sp.]